MIVATIGDAVAAADFGKASAAKRGRNPEWPYVPVINYGDTPVGAVPATRTRQIKGKAFATRGEAVDYAARCIAHQRDTLARQLAEPRHRALREHYGLPRELT